MMPIQFATVLFLAFVLVVVLPVYRSRREKGSKPLLSRLMYRKKGGPDRPSSVTEQERNGTKLDLMVAASVVTNVVKLYKWFIIMPGYVTAAGEQATLSGIIVTRQGLVAFKCYGFGGRISVQSGTWHQQLRGMERTLPDIEADCHRQKEILLRVMEQCGLKDLPVQVCAVFTTDGVDLSHAKDSLCFTREGFADHLHAPPQQKDTGVDPQRTGRLISSCVVKRQE